jgi:hypothetical protein
VLIGPHGESLFTRGVQLSLSLSHNGLGTRPVTVHAISLTIDRYLPSYAQAYRPSGLALSGAGTVQPHRFTVMLDGAKVAQASWMLPGTSVGQRARSANFLDLPDPRRLTFSPWHGETEQIQGTVVAETAGLYEFSLRVDYSVGTVDRSHRSRRVSLLGKALV